MKQVSFLVIFAILSGFSSVFIDANPTFRLTEPQKRWFDAMEQEWMTPFKKLANLDDQEMKVVIDTINDMKKQRFDWLFQSEKIKYHHDKSIPDNIMQKIYTILQKHGINPHRIDIRSPLCSPIWAFASISDQPNVSSKSQNRKIVTLDFQYGQKSNPTLWIYEPCYTMSDEILENTLLHECGHLAEAHGGQRELLTKLLDEKNITEEEQDTFFKRFTCVIELIADQRLTIGSEDRVVKMLSEYGKKEYNKEMVVKSLTGLSKDCLKINYDDGYPSYSVRWLSLMAMMKSMSQKIQENL